MKKITLFISLLFFSFIGYSQVSNETCENAIALSCGDSVQGTTITASQSGLVTPTCTGGTPADVFYTLDVVENVEYTVSVNGDNYDGVLVIYTGSCGSLTEIYCADNGFSAGIEESITFTASTNETVVIRTYDWSSTQGDFTITAVCSSVSIKESNMIAETRLFPNPLSNNTFFVHAPKLNGEHVEVNIVDMAGRQVFNNTLDFNDNKITVSVDDDLTSGMYFVTIKHAGEAHTYKLLKE